MGPDMVGWMLQAACLLYVLSLAGYVNYLFAQRDRVQQIAFRLVGIGVLIHGAAMVILGADMGGLPVHNMVQSLSLAALALGLMFLYVQYQFNLKVLGVFAAGVLSVIMILVMVLPDAPVASDRIFRGFWFYSHILLVFTGEALLGLACGAGILYLLQEKGIKARTPGFFFRRLPSLDFLDTVSYTCITTGFVLLTFGLITGFVYAKTLWGRFWSWDFKEVFSVGTWLVYAALLHLRLYAGWRGRKSAMMTIVGFGIIIFTFLGVNLLLGGHHQEFTR